MGGADISDIAYSGFLVNGEERQEYPDFEPGERIRLRIINASASSYYWLTFGGGDEYGDWIFHCHILYHMMGGMSRIYLWNPP